MYKIQEVVHKFRSGSTSEKKGEEEEDGGGGGGGVLSSQATGILSAITTFANNTTSAGGEGGVPEREGSRWYQGDHTDGLSSSLPLSEKAELSSLPVITPAGLHQTALATARGQPGDSAPQQPLATPTSLARDTATRPLPPSPDRKLGRAQPKGTLEYKVGKTDTLEKIAAHFDVTPSELKKLNRLSFHMVFENQVLYIPDPNYVPSDPSTPDPQSAPQSPVYSKPKLDIPIVKMSDKPSANETEAEGQVPPPPASAPPLTTTRPPFSLSRTLSEGAGESNPAEEDSPERFIKLSAQIISEGFEKVPGTLLVTTNAIMFEPDLTDDRVIEEGADGYSAFVCMDTLLSAAIYQDLSALRFHTRCSSESELLEKPEIYHGEVVRARSASTSSLANPTKPCAPGPNLSQPSQSSSSSAGKSGSTGKSLQPPPAAAPPSGITMAPLFPSSVSPAEGSASQLETEEGDSGSEREVQQQTEEGNVVVVDGRSDLSDFFTDISITSGLEPVVKKQSEEGSGSLSQEGSEQGMKEEEGERAGGGEEGGSQATPPPQTALQEERSEQSGTAQGVSKDREEEDGSGSALHSPGLLVNKRAQDVVEEILEAVSSGGVCVDTDKDSNTVLEGREDGCGEDKKEAGKEGGAVVQDAGREGEEMRIGNIVYFPLEETSEGKMVVRDTNSVTAPPDSTSQPPQPRTTNSGGKPKPPPLTTLGVDSTDGTSPTGFRARTLSESFSPLRSSAQHLSNFVNYATGFFRSSTDDRASVKDVHDLPAMRDRSLTTPVAGEREKKKGSEGDAQQSAECMFMSAVKAEERPELFKTISDLIPPQEDIHKQPALYFHLRVDTEECDRRMATSAPMESHRHQLTKPHYWFSVPRNKGEHLYAFFVRWKPDVYGADDINPEDSGFVVVDRVDVTEHGSSLPFMDDHFGQQLSSSFKKDWEIVSREELRRRASIVLDLDHLLMPELSEDSTVMTEDQIMELAGRLPARTVGYRWSLVYSTALHGFSLKRLYRELFPLDSPILLVLQDTQDVVFGAYLSDPPRLSDHFYGTGTCQLWTFREKLQVFCWSEDNAYFIRGDECSLSIGASRGSNGLWIDSDLYHGHSQPCATFSNCVLSAKEDFIIKSLEAWAFY
ncbi:oxidation resistance protein 1-like [Babylonia areolata]|uniref:oxidation resistance protein 1-like n=1 Tax=Babylonia areolata TaxID=304850 RepID=UPI003FCF3833